ncbi:hypothetical protein [Fodinicola acaciae]|uniref:hypothetical protein n=1 Tax=Fodinicola acaciae TaxID=2681555 RepID=UPI0013D16052|nr:hypothetical protein [Fodinicola acaciae]
MTEWFAFPDDEPAAPAYAYSVLSILRRNTGSWATPDLRPEDTSAVTRFGVLTLLIDICDYDEKVVLSTLRLDVGVGFARMAWCEASRADVEPDIEQCTGFRAQTLRNPTVRELFQWISEQLRLTVVRVRWFDNIDEPGATAWIAHDDAVVLVWSGNRPLIDGDRQADLVEQVR